MKYRSSVLGDSSRARYKAYCIKEVSVRNNFLVLDSYRYKKGDPYLARGDRLVGDAVGERHGNLGSGVRLSLIFIRVILLVFFIFTNSIYFKFSNH